jgi:hypothetical protein
MSQDREKAAEQHAALQGEAERRVEAAEAGAKALTGAHQAAVLAVQRTAALDQEVTQAALEFTQDERAAALQEQKRTHDMAKRTEAKRAAALEKAAEREAGERAAAVRRMEVEILASVRAPSYISYHIFQSGK